MAFLVSLPYMCFLPLIHISNKILGYRPSLGVKRIVPVNEIGSPASLMHKECMCMYGDHSQGKIVIKQVGGYMYKMQ